MPPYGPRSGHWAKNAQGGGEGGDDVWAAERVLPHGTVQNLSKWSMYKEDGVLEGYTPAPQTTDGKPQGTDWSPEREKVPGQGWYDKVSFVFPYIFFVLFLVLCQFKVQQKCIYFVLTTDEMKLEC